MSVESLMTQAVTVRIPSGQTVEFGEMVTTYDDVETTMYLEPRSSDEDVANRNTPMSLWNGYGKLTVPFTSDSVVVYGDRTFYVFGDPMPWTNPHTGSNEHWEMTLQEVDHDASVS